MIHIAQYAPTGRWRVIETFTGTVLGEFDTPIEAQNHIYHLVPPEKPHQEIPGTLAAVFAAEEADAKASLTPPTHSRKRTRKK